MPAGKHKSGRYRKVSVRTPGGKTVTHFRERKPSAAKCAIFGTKLNGVPRERPAKLGKLSKSQRRPERPFGGVLGSKGMRAVIRAQARSKHLNEVETAVREELESIEEEDVKKTKEVKEAKEVQESEEEQLDENQSEEVGGDE
jgi:large subunit ribosomal protein L34e